MSLLYFIQPISVKKKNIRIIMNTSMLGTVSNVTGRSCNTVSDTKWYRYYASFM